MKTHKVLLSYTVAYILRNDGHTLSLNCEASNCVNDCIFVSTAALVIVSEVADQVNDNLKHGVSFLCVRERVVVYMIKEERVEMMSPNKVSQVSGNKDSSVKRPV